MTFEERRVTLAKAIAAGLDMDWDAMSREDQYIMTGAAEVAYTGTRFINPNYDGARRIHDKGW